MILIDIKLTKPTRQIRAPKVTEISSIVRILINVKLTRPTRQIRVRIILIINPTRETREIRIPRGGHEDLNPIADPSTEISPVIATYG